MKSALITLLGMVTVQGVEVVEMVIYQTTNCSSSVAATVPYLVANGCHNVIDNISLNVTCSNGVPSLEYFTSSPNCEGTPLAVTETCTAGDSVTSGSSTINIPAIGYTCADLPDDDVIVLTIGDTCVGGDISTVSFSYTMVVNQCLTIPTVSGFPSGMYEVTISSSNVLTFNVYSGTSCTGSPLESYIGAFGGCFTATATTAAGRLLISTVAMKAEPAVAGVQIQTDSPASKVNGDLISLLLVMIAAVFIGA